MEFNPPTDPNVIHRAPIVLPDVCMVQDQDERIEQRGNDYHPAVPVRPLPHRRSRVSRYQSHGGHKQGDDGNDASQGSKINFSDQRV